MAGISQRVSILMRRLAPVPCGGRLDTGPNPPSDTGILDSAYLCSNTAGMKVAVSIPDDVFAEAESLAKQLKASRSEIYSRALGEFLGRHAPDRVTEQMNDVISSVGEGTDDFSRRAARRALRRVEW
jgi:hypothetical protein